MGRGQSIRGVKFEEARPDMVFIDDVENEGDVRSPDARQKVWDWVTKELIPACEPPGRRKIRMAATPLHPEAVSMRLKKDPSWKVKTIPVYYLDADGEKRSSWPERWPLYRIMEMEVSMPVQAFRQEYMCEAEAPETKLFKQEMFRIEPRVRTWQAVYSMTDPARTTTKTSATTGRVVWSWIGHELIVWDAVARKWMPNEIIDDLFQVNEQFHPVKMGFEEDGLNQWALQAIRQEQTRRGIVLPLKPMRAPPSKLDFIGGLQNYFMARAVVFANQNGLPELTAQLLGFPNGNIDAPNALAYAPRMRAGAPVYDDFGVRNVEEDLRPGEGSQLWLVLNATQAGTTGCAVQFRDGCVRIFADWVREGAADLVVAEIVSQARLECGRELRLVAGPRHFDRYNNVGLVQAVQRLPARIDRGTNPERGQSYIRQLLQRERHGMPALMVAANATWTLRAFSGGYCRVLEKNGMLSSYAEEGEYRVLMEGLESFVGLLELGFGEGEERDRFNAVTPQGRPFRSMMAGANTPRASKSDWNTLLRGGQ